MPGSVSTLGMSGGGFPRNITTYTSGSGTFTPQSATKYIRLTMLGGGGGGGSLGNSGVTGVADAGYNAMPVYVWLQKSAGSYSYSIGAGGAVNAALTGSDGGNTTFGTFTAYGGKGGWGASAGAGSNHQRPSESNGWGLQGTGNTAAGTGYGAGGGGATTVSTLGGAGTGGLLIVEEYY